MGVVLLVAILGVTVVFAYGSYKDLELKKEEAKITENKQKDSKNKTLNQNEIKKSPNTNEEVNTDEVRTTEDGEEIKKTKK